MKHLFVLIFIFFLLIGCGSNKPSSQPFSSPSYEELLKDDDINKHLTTLLNSTSLSEKNESKRFLIEHHEKSVSRLIKLLTQSWDRGTRNRAAYALGLIGTAAKSAIPHLFERIEKEDTSYVRQMCAWALTQMKDEMKNEISRLEKLLKNEDRIIRQQASIAFLNLGKEAQVSADFLIDIFYDDSEQIVTRNVAKVLRNILDPNRFFYIEKWQEIYYRAFLYTSICYRYPDPKNHSAYLQKGIQSSEQREYYIELKKKHDDLVMELEEKSSIPEKLEGVHTELARARRIYSNESILSCAQRNFIFTSAYDQEWFKIFDRYGVEGKSFKEGIIKSKLDEKILKNPLIMIGNTHPIAIKNGEVLFDLTNFLNTAQYQTNLFVESRASASYEFDEIQTFYADHPQKDKYTIDEIVTEWLSLNPPSLRPENYEYLDKPREIIQLKYALTYPNSQVLGIDLGDKRPQGKMLGVNIPLLQRYIGNLLPHQKWLAYYGEAHTIRFKENDTSIIENSLTYQNEKFSPFVIAQHGTMDNLCLKKECELEMPSYILGSLLEKFQFPLEIDFKKNSFRSYLNLILDKYVAKGTTLFPLYVNLSKASEDKAFSFNENYSVADLLIIPPLKNKSSSYFDDDFAYQTLKDILEHPTLEKMSL